MTREPNPAYLKLRFVSDHNPDDVWLKFPLSGAGAIDAPEQSDEMRVALASLRAISLEECHAVECVSQYPTLARCLDAHAGEPLEQILWKAHNLGFAESELGQFGSDQNCAMFAAAYRTLAANLSSSTSHTLDCSPAALKLASNEYITDIRFEFGTVKAGFQESEAPSFIVNTLATLPDGTRIVNHTDVGGKSDDAEVTAEDIWVTIALGKPKGCLPRTGY